MTAVQQFWVIDPEDYLVSGLYPIRNIDDEAVQVGVPTFFAGTFDLEPAATVTAVMAFVAGDLHDITTVGAVQRDGESVAGYIGFSAGLITNVTFVGTMQTDDPERIQGGGLTFSAGLVTTVTVLGPLQDDLPDRIQGGGCTFSAGAYPP